MAAFTVTWTDGHVETIQSERYDYVDVNDAYLFHDGGAGKQVATVPNVRVRLIRRASEQDPTGPGYTDRCVECGSGRVSHEGHKGRLLCGPCYDGDGWPDHPRKGRVAPVGPSDTAPEATPHVHPGGIDSDLINPVKDAKRFTIGGRG